MGIIKGRQIGGCINGKVITPVRVKVNSNFKDDVSEIKYVNPFEDQQN